jgi:dGTPase
MDWRRLLSPKRLRGTTRSTNGDRRNDFESDYGRIVFSPAIRRMHDKTQVFPTRIRGQVYFIGIIINIIINIVV